MASYTFLGNPPPNVQEWIEKTYLTIYKVQTTASYKKTGIYSAQRDDTSKPVKIDWGDGSIKEVDGDISQEVHEYSDVGEFTVKVSNIKTFAASVDNTIWYNTTSQNNYTFKALVNLNKAVTTIRNNAFRGCSGLTSVTIGNGVTSIGNYAFYYCSGLTSITIGNGVTSIGHDAFYHCSRLTSITIPDSVTSIGDWAFLGCSGLTSVTIPNSMTSIGAGVFSDCSGLTSVTIPDSVTSIGGSAFYGCSWLTSVNITDIAKWCSISFSNYAANPLYYAHNLYLNGSLVEDLAIPDSVTSIGNYAFRSCSGLTSVTIPAGVTSIGQFAFSGCSGLTSVTIPDSVTSIGSYAFSGCSGLTSVTIPDSVTSISDEAFFGCSGLTSVTIGNSVTSIGGSAFSDCSGLTSVTFDGTTVPTGSYSCFYDTSSLNDVYMMNIDVSMVQDQLNSNISNWELGVNGDGTYHTVTIHCMNGKVVIDPTPSGSSS